MYSTKNYLMLNGSRILSTSLSFPLLGYLSIHSVIELCLKSNSYARGSVYCYLERNVKLKYSKVLLLIIKHVRSGLK